MQAVQKNVKGEINDMSNESDGKKIEVSCAIIERDGLVLAAQRSETMSMPLKWEFPGGKMKEGEEPDTCLKRELMEEMGITVIMKKMLPPLGHHYPDFTVTLYPFVCAIDAGEIVLHEHRAIAWMKFSELASLDWVEADLPVVYAYRRSFSSQTP